MLNECEFSSSAKDIEKLIASACEGIIVTGKVVYDPEMYKSTFEIYAENYETLSATRVPGLCDAVQVKPISVRNIKNFPIPN